MTAPATWPSAASHLRLAFPPAQIGQIPASKGRPALDFVGHAAVTDRLNTYAPDWTYTVDHVFEHGGAFWIRGTMTIGGISRVEYGDGTNPKEAIGNFIRRAAMRYGVAIDLWSREELDGGTGSQQAPHNEGVSPSTGEGKDARAEKSEPAGVTGNGEGASTPAGEDTPEKIVDVVELWTQAAERLGSTPKVVRWMHERHPDWNIRSEADVSGWHLIALLEELAA
jgi:hypothetical protein